MNVASSVLVETHSLRLLLVDDHPLFLDGLSVVLENAYENVAVTSALTMDNAIRALESPHEFDLITLDWSLPDGKGGALLRYIQDKRLFIPVLVVSATDNPLDLRLAMNSGASGFVSKSLGRSALLEAIAQVLQGEIYINAGTPCLHGFSLANPAPSLTARQKEVLNLLGRGWSNKMICASLSLTEHTVKTHLKALFHLLAVRNRTECVRKAQSLGLVET
jgi:DNA-binding NarL/FixJ family response regulator